MKNPDKIALESLAMDLKRASVFLNRKSENAANRFLEEALKRRSEIEMSGLENYLKKIILDLDKRKTAEDYLMYSTLIQNYSLSL